MRTATTIDLDISAEEAWRLAANQFGDTGEWTSRLTSSYLDGEEMGVGATRTCRIGEDVQKERITAYHPDEMTFSYALLEPPSWVESATNTWTVDARGHDRSALTMDLAMEVTGWIRPVTPLLSFGLRRVLKEVQEEFKHWAETGTPHPRKRAHSKKNAKWRTPDVLRAPNSK